MAFKMKYHKGKGFPFTDSPMKGKKHPHAATVNGVDMPIGFDDEEGHAAWHTAAAAAEKSPAKQSMSKTKSKIKYGLKKTKTKKK